MEDDRIERALRQGPVDEPIYVPGSFRRAPRAGASLAVLFASVAAALVLGIVFGLGLGVMRTPGNVGAPPADTGSVAAHLVGRWTSDEMTRDEWTRGLLALGFHIDDVEAFQRHDPIGSTVRYELEFRDGWLDLFVEAPPNSLVEIGDGPYQILASGQVYFDDRQCFVTLGFDIDGDRLTFDRISTESCGVEEQLANSAFFNLSSYTRIDGE